MEESKYLTTLEGAREHFLAGVEKRAALRRNPVPDSRKYMKGIPNRKVLKRIVTDAILHASMFYCIDVLESESS